MDKSEKEILKKIRNTVQKETGAVVLFAFYSLAHLGLGLIIRTFYIIRIYFIE